MRRLLAIATLLLAFGPGAPPASAVATQNIHTEGPLTDVWIGTDLSCQVGHEAFGTYGFFPPRQTLADCGTFLSVGDTVFGPDFVSHPETSFPGAANYAAFTSTSQSGVTGTGTAASPHQIVTTVSAGDTGLSITETDSYVVGDESYRTDIAVSNSGLAPVAAILYHAADCYLAGSDTGFGALTPDRAIACAANAHNFPSGQVEELAPLTPGFHYVEGEFSGVWSAVLAQRDLPDSCDCGIDQDNGVAVNWSITVPAGESVTYSLISNFSSEGRLTGAPAVETGPATHSLTRATVTGSVDPEGNAVTDCLFFWGTSDSYGRSEKCADGVGAGTDPVDVSAELGDLEPGTTYHYRLSATTSGGGTMTGEDRTFSTPPPPVLGKRVNLVPISGVVLVRTPRRSGGGRGARGLRATRKGKGFVPLAEARHVPVGSIVDARRGTLDLVAAGAQRRRTGSARLAKGLFSVSQTKKGRRKGLTTFTLKHGLFKGAPSFKRCPGGKRKGGKSSVAHAAGASPKAIQTLRARSSKGKFRSKGKHSAGTVRGTVWETTDRCDGTLTTVKRGIVDVRNFGLRKTVPVRAGFHYLSAADPSKQRKPQPNR